MSREDELLRLRTEIDYLRSLLLRHNEHTDASPAAVSVVTDACAPRRVEQQADSSLNGTGRFSWDKNGHNLNKDQIARYSRQIIMPSFGAQGMCRDAPFSKCLHQALAAEIRNEIVMRASLPAVYAS